MSTLWVRHEDGTESVFDMAKAEAALLADHAKWMEAKEADAAERVAEDGSGAVPE